MSRRRERADELWILLLALALGWWSYGSPFGEEAGWEFRPKPSGALRIVTWNVGGGSGVDGNALRNEHLRHVVETLEALKPDVVMLQEVDSQRQLEWLLRRLSGDHFDDWRGWLADGQGRRVAVLGPMRSRRDVEVLRGDGGRRMIQAVLRHRRHEDVVLLGVHADAFSAEARNRELGAAADLLAAHPASFKILLGDFNLDLDLDKRRDLFTDDEHRDVETYNYLCEDLEDLGLGAGPTAEPDRRLDYILVSRSGWEARSAGPWRGQRIGDMDHDPVVADLEFD